MKHSVRSTLVTLGLGTTMQRVLQLVTFLAIGRALGAPRLGQFAEGQALAATARRLLAAPLLRPRRRGAIRPRAAR